MVESFVMKGVQGAEDLVGLPTKAVETLDMLQKSQINVGGDLTLEPKTVKSINHMVRNVILALLVCTLFIGACMLCAAGAETGGQWMLTGAGYGFGAVGFVLMIYVFFTVRND